jgi:hypothetical protein
MPARILATTRARILAPILTAIFAPILVSIFVTLPLRAQDQAATTPSPIATDRPAITNSSVTVPRLGLQVENGLLETGSRQQSVIDAPESLVRFGLANKTELRLTVPDYFQNLTGGGAIASGFGDFAFGVKQQLGPWRKYDVSVIAFLSLPTGANGVSSGAYDPGVQIPWSRALSANWTAAGMFSVYFPTQGSTRNGTGEATFLFDRQLTKPWDAFVEYAGDFPESGGPRHLLHFGTAFKLAPRQQIDFHAGFGLSSATVDHIVGVGYSFLFQASGRKP